MPVGGWQVNSKAITTTVNSCQRCGWDHYDHQFEPLANPADEWTHWAPCPVTGQPVLLSTSLQPDKPAPQPGSLKGRIDIAPDFKEEPKEVAIESAYVPPQGHLIAYLFAAKDEPWKVGTRVRLETTADMAHRFMGEFVVVSVAALGSVQLASVGEWWAPDGLKNQMWVKLSEPFNRMADVQILAQAEGVAKGDFVRQHAEAEPIQVRHLECELFDEFTPKDNENKVTLGSEPFWAVAQDFQACLYFTSRKFGGDDPIELQPGSQLRSTGAYVIKPSADQYKGCWRVSTRYGWMSIIVREHVQEVDRTC